jgi:hypothetical protein
MYWLDEERRTVACRPTSGSTNIVHIFSSSSILHSSGGQAVLFFVLFSAA